jgi:hypothetical protein
VIDKSVVNKADLLEMYYPDKDVGRLYKNGDFFESGVNPDHIMFETERGDVVYFAMAANSEDTLSIYKMVKLIDGWGDSESLGEPVNSIYNDAYPFLETDGLTLYFASDRPGGMGGFDIYKVYYDNETHSFFDPINLGVPFNSPDDDFLFVSDEFNKVAWFASTRETSNGEIAVYTIRWDGTQVRNMVEDQNQVRESAMLKIDGDDGSALEEGEDFTYNNNRKKRTVKALFYFEINDTITYTQYDHFLNSEALELFKAGFKLEQQKDSLSLLMKTKRAQYSVVNNTVERNEIVNEILRLENQVYSLDDQIKEKYLYARQKELNEILNRLKSGTYNPSRKVKTEKSETLLIDGILIPEKYSMFTKGEFESHYLKNESMYKKLFSVNDINSLRVADSLYVWANILNLESSQLLAKSTKVEEDNGLKISNLIKRNDSLENEDGESSVEKMIKESKELKILSTRIYHKSLDKKYPIYWLKLKDVSSKLDGQNNKEIGELVYQGNAYFREAKRSLDVPGGLNIEGYEKAGMMKKAGIESMQNALYLYCNIIKEGYRPKQISKTVPKGVVQKSYNEIHRGEEKEKEVKKIVEKPTENLKELIETKKKPEETGKKTSVDEEYRVQIGVFRNPPNPDALAKIPTVSSMELQGRGLTKYFSGHFVSKEEAVKVIPQIIEAGFPGAFVVYFKEGRISTMPKE